MAIKVPQDQTSGRTYVSAVERGVKVPTLSKVDALAEEFGVHPLTMLALAYCPTATSESLHRVFAQVLADTERMQIRQFETGNLPKGAKPVQGA